MSEAQGVGLLGAVVFGGFLLFGFITDAMPMMIGLKMDRYENPIGFWVYAAADAFLMVFFAAVAITSPW